jgi:hypothetical protein
MKEIILESTIENRPYPPYISLILRGEALDPEKITEMLGINPTKSAKHGDKRGRSNKWPHGIWILESSEQIESVDPIKHIIWLLDKLEPSKTNLIEISRDQTIDAEISCFWIMPNTHEVLTIAPELLSRISALNVRFELSIYAPSEG